MLRALACAMGVVLAAAVARGLAAPPARGARDRPDRPGWVGSRPRSAVERWLRERRRRHELASAWPVVADEMAATLRAGASLHQALSSVADGAGEAAEALTELLETVGRGQALVDGAASWRARARSPAEALVAEAVQLAAWTGRPEPLLFDTVADSLRERLALAGELRAQTAQARASAAVLVLLPVAFTLLVTINDPRAAHFLFGTIAGATCAAAGLALDGAGAWWMRATMRRAVP